MGYALPATHKKSGHTGEVQDAMTDDDGRQMYYFEDNQRPTVAGWYLSGQLTIPGVNAASA